MATTTSPQTSSDFRKLLDGRISKVMRDTMEYPGFNKMVPNLYRVENSGQAWEEFLSVPGLPNIPKHVGRLTFRGRSPGYHIRIEHAEFAMATSIERKLMDDEKYGVMSETAKELVVAGERTREHLGARPFQNAFSAAFDHMVEHEEGLSLCSNSHTSRSGVSTATGFDNLGTSALNKTSLSAARLLMRRFRDDIGYLVNGGDEFILLVPESLYQTATELVQSAQEVGTANNTMNFHKSRYEVMTWNLLDDVSTTNWFLIDKAMMKKFLLWFNRIQTENRMFMDDYTFETIFRTYFRLSYGFTNWRWIVGHQVS